MGISNLTGKRVKKGKSLLMKCDKPVLNRPVKSFLFTILSGQYI